MVTPKKKKQPGGFDLSTASAQKYLRRGFFAMGLLLVVFNLGAAIPRFQRWLKERILSEDEIEQLSSDQLIPQSECDEIHNNLEIDYDILMEMNPKLKRQKTEILNDAKYRIEATKNIREKLASDNGDLAKELGTLKEKKAMLENEIRDAQASGT